MTITKIPQTANDDFEHDIAHHAPRNSHECETCHFLCNVDTPGGKKYDAYFCESLEACCVYDVRDGGITSPYGSSYQIPQPESTKIDSDAEYLTPIVLKAAEANGFLESSSD